MSLLRNIFTVLALSSLITSCGNPALYSAEFFSDKLSDGIDGPQLSVIPAGAGIAGEEYTSSIGYHGPQRSIKNNTVFAITRAEVTFAQYDKFANATNRKLPDDRGWGRGDMPVINVSWMDATAYTKWLTEQTNQYYRLPSETEWEYAARAGTKTIYWWGKEYIQSKEHCDRDIGGCKAGTEAAQPWISGRYNANPYGLFDVSSNVAEWVMDCDDEKNRANDTTPVKTGDCEYRIIKGGDYSSRAHNTRLSARHGFSVDDKSPSLGFRLVREMH
ncbi:SUMF1/EgtB/PvdO family nonheme iron enzyme [Rheinheimera baltica]|uniref:formylglycine-generating enzyme family protein n=1 Tax=Rheinheimera baltica TaxID=67576 RepID=UPI00273E9F61|nr:SUMF1/EgtB/PvdO family nonheme iron enzyme [Rheinheimera baltica]MDP5141232.1 SUMF1/EgtB/PvdO family nonheme iron enzyme [Rheinheimera baltica]